jgi:major membrane immunogen (membrane-anchored lipoprotein)
MRKRAGIVPLGVAVAATLALTACSQSDRTEVATFTDEHGRVCTAAVVVDSEDGDREVQSLDCDYPPEGVTPGPSGYTDLP